MPRKRAIKTQLALINIYGTKLTHDQQISFNTVSGSGVRRACSHLKKTKLITNHYKANIQFTSQVNCVGPHDAL